MAAFPLGCGSVACLQQQDEQGLRRGGVYLCAGDDPLLPARAPRFDELFADVAQKLLAAPALRPGLLGSLEAAHLVARGTRPRLGPEALAAIQGVLQGARALRDAAPAGGLDVEELVACCLLIFVSEEERYPRPKYRGADVAWERLLEAVGPDRGDGRVAGPGSGC